MPELAFVVPETDVDGAADLARALSGEVGRKDAASLLCAGFPPEPRPDRAYVAFGAGGSAEGEPTAAQLSRTVLVLLAPPGSERFASGAELARRAGAAFHVNSAATERLLEIGVPARHLQLGHTPGCEGSNRSGARELPIAPIEQPELLARGRLTTIRDSGGYFEWVRALRAIHLGAVVLHEHSLGMEPLVADRHLFVAEPAALDSVAAALVEDPQRLEEVRREALDFLREALPLAIAAAALIGAARALVAQPLPAAVAPTPGHSTLRSK
jgi:hypothetical protein